MDQIKPYEGNPVTIRRGSIDAVFTSIPRINFSAFITGSNRLTSFSHNSNILKIHYAPFDVVYNAKITAAFSHCTYLRLACIAIAIIRHNRVSSWIEDVVENAIFRKGYAW